MARSAAADTAEVHAESYMDATCGMSLAEAGSLGLEAASILLVGGQSWVSRVAKGTTAALPKQLVVNPDFATPIGDVRSITGTHCVRSPSYNVGISRSFNRVPGAMARQL
jgi:hypothetical protein